MKTTSILLGVAASALLASCGTKAVPVNVSLDYVVGAETMEMDTVRFTNEAGNDFSVTRLEYYLSGFVLTNADGEEIALDDVFYVSAADAMTSVLDLGELEQGLYTKLEFNLGIVPDFNYLDSLPNTLEHVGMQWPQMMGGGLHFIKMEGHFIDHNGDRSGYAVHLGTNPTLIPIVIDQDFNISDGDATLGLTMDILEWYKNPEVYDLNGQNYTMGDSLLMQKIKSNGGDVFTLH